MSYQKLPSSSVGPQVNQLLLASSSSQLARQLSHVNAQQKRLFLLLFLWTCLCFYLFKLHNQQISTPTTTSASNLIISLDGQPEELGSSAQFRDDQFLERPQVARSQSSSLANGIIDKNQIQSITTTTTTRKISDIATSDQSISRSITNEEFNLKAPISEVTSSERHTRPEVRKQQPNKRVIKQHHHFPHLREPKGSTCQYNYPSLLDLQFNNIHWQKLTSRKDPNDTRREFPKQQAVPANYYLYNAYYDDRTRTKQPYVRILAMIDRNEPPITNCLLWSKKLIDPEKKNPSGNQMRPLISEAEFVYAWYNKWGNHHDGMLQPWIITCPVPEYYITTDNSNNNSESDSSEDPNERQLLIPDHVSLVEAPPQIIRPPPTPEATLDTSNSEELDQLEDVIADDLSAAAAASSANQGSPPQRAGSAMRRRRRKRADTQVQSSSSQASLPMPPASSSSSSPPSSSSAANSLSPSSSTGVSMKQHSTNNNNAATATSTSSNQLQLEWDCPKSLPITNLLEVHNERPEVKQKFAVCVKGLDFPHDDLSVRLIEWIELLNLLGASKIFLYNLNVHENITKVLHYYKERGMIELIPLTLPGNQPNSPDIQHTFLRQKLTTKRQNELIPYNDCLYRNLYSYEYLALLDIDEIIMPLRHHNWYGLMDEVERVSLSEQNYTRASYNARNVYFFDDLVGPLGTTSSSSSSPSLSEADKSQSSAYSETNGEPAAAPISRSHDDGTVWEHGIPPYLHMMQHVYRSKNYTKPGQYVKCFHNTERVVSLHNHFPMNCFGQCTTYSIPVSLAHVQHYRRDCVGPLQESCKKDFRKFTTRDTTIWKYKQQMIRRATRVLNHLNLMPTNGR